MESMDVIASSSEMSDLIQRIYKACTVVRTRQFQCWVLHWKCLQLNGYVLAWKTGASRDEFLERAGQAMVEMVNCFRRALKLVSECGCEWWLQQALIRQHGEEEFVELVEDLEVCVDVIVFKVLAANEIMEQQVSGDRLVIRDELRDAAHRDKVDLVEYLRSHEDDMLCQHLLHRLEAREFEPLQVEDGDVRKDGSLIGKGASGTVYKGSWKDLPVAVKVFKPDDATFEKELEVMRYLAKPHPHVLQMFCYLRNAEEQAIAMELMKMDLKKFLGGRKLSLVTAVDILLQVARGTRHMHSQDVAHRDLKPQNVLVDFDCDEIHQGEFQGHQGEFQGRVNVLLNDFGIAKTGFNTMVDERFTHMRGTPRYMAPEMLAEYHSEERYSRKVDVYSFGVLCSEVLTGSAPFGTENPDIQTLKSMLTAGRRPQLPENCPEELLDLINRCWHTDSEKRPTFDVVEQELSQLKKQLLAPRPSSTQQSSCNNSQSSSSGSSSSLSPLTVAQASVQDLRISGSAEVGGRLNVKFRPVNGTKFCICRWTRKGPPSDHAHKPVMVMLTSVAATEFHELSLTLTAEDYKRKLQLEIVPLNAELKAGRPVTKTTGTIRNTQGEEQIRLSWENGQACYKVKRLRDRFWDSTGKLYINRKDCYLWWGQGNPKNSRFNFEDADPNEVPIELSREDPLVCNLKKSDGSFFPVKFTSSTNRDNAVLTTMYFWERREQPERARR